jgi:putative membrane protein
MKKLNKNSNWFVLLFSKPALYLYSLLKRTLIVGIILFVLCEIVKYFDIHDQPIPTSWHSSAGIVIGLLLVFRTNTAYDRWWEARKIFSNLESSFIYIKLTCGESETIKKTLVSLNNDLFRFVSSKTKDESKNMKLDFLNQLFSLKEKTLMLFNGNRISTQEYAVVEKKISDILESFTSLERIKKTPIPISYSLHIKISLFAYLLTLPLGLFFGLGLFSIPMVMVLFFIIAGIEIISNEIENPFRGDPNDLPLEEFRIENEKFIK